MIDWIKTRLDRERAAWLGLVATLMLFAQDLIVGTAAWDDWRNYVPLVVALVIRTFVTSEGV